MDGEASPAAAPASKPQAIGSLPGWRAALLAAAPVLFVGGGVGAVVGSGGSASVMPPEKLSRWTANVTSKPKVQSTCNSSQPIPPKGQKEEFLFDVGSRPGLHMQAYQRSDPGPRKVWCPLLFEFALRKGVQVPDGPINVRISYRLQDRKGWFNVQVKARCHCGHLGNPEPNDGFSQRCPWHWDTPGASEGSYFMDLAVPAERIKANGRLTLEFVIEGEITENKPASGRVLIDSITLTGAT